jgi:flagellar biosynthesis GTPase FlhF
MAAANTIRQLFNRGRKADTADPAAADLQRRVDAAQALCSQDAQAAATRAEEARQALAQVSARADGIRAQIERLQARADEQGRRAAADQAESDERRQSATRAYATAVAAGDAQAEQAATQELQASDAATQQPSVAQRQQAALLAEIAARQRELDQVDAELRDGQRVAVDAECEAAAAEFDEAANAFALAAMRTVRAFDERERTLPGAMQGQLFVPFIDGRRCCLTGTDGGGIGTHGAPQLTVGTLRRAFPAQG